MIIVSQDKKHTSQSLDLDIENLSFFDDDNKFHYGGYGIKELKYQRIMGIYETEERANKILKEIIKAYKIYKGSEYSIRDRQKLLGDYEYGVYEMPEE